MTDRGVSSRRTEVTAAIAALHRAPPSDDERGFWDGLAHALALAESAAAVRAPVTAAERPGLDALARQVRSAIRTRRRELSAGADERAGTVPPRIARMARAAVLARLGALSPGQPAAHGGIERLTDDALRRMLAFVEAVLARADRGRRGAGR